MAYTGETLLLLPQEKEICVKFVCENKVRISKDSVFKLFIEGLYTGERFVKKRWKMFINRPENKVYILTGFSKIKTVDIMGNVGVIANDGTQKFASSFYLKLPYCCTSNLIAKITLPSNLKAEFLPQKIYNGEGCKEIYVLGKVILFAE